MAVVGSAYVVVRAITDKVESDIKRAFRGSTVTAGKAGRDMGSALTRGLNLGAKNNKFNALANQLRTLYPEADQAASSFTSLVRRGYVAQAGIGALAGSVGALVGGLGGLVGAIGGAAPALVALGTAAITAKVGMSIAKFSLGGVSEAVKNATKPTSALGSSVEDLAKKYEDLQFSAEEAALGVDRSGLNLEKARNNLLRTADLGPSSMARKEAKLAFREAELAYRKALANRDDLQDQVNKGISGLGSGANDPFAGLNDAQRKFAEFLVTLDPLMKDLKDAASEGFLPILEAQMQRLVDSDLPGILERRFYDLGQAVGGAVTNFTDILLARDNLQKLDDVMGNMADYMPSFGTILGNLFDGLLTAVKEADPLTRDFLKFLEEKSSSWATFLDIKAASGELQEFFNQAGDIAGKLGTIIGQTFDGIKNIVMANFTPGTGGWAILDWLDKITKGWADADSGFMKTYFARSADNFIAMGDAIGGAVESLLRVGADPAVAEFWRALDSGSYEFSRLLDSIVGSSPALGEVLASLTGIVSALTDSSVPQTFLDTINFAFGGLEQILIALKPFLDSFVGQIFAVLSALGFLFLMLQKIGTIGVGFVGKLALGIGSILPASSAASASLLATAAAAQATTAAASGVAVATPVAAAGLTGMGTAAAGAGAATMVALAPLAPLIAGIAIAVAAIALVVGVKASQMEKATEGVAKGFKAGADAATIWGEATKSTMDGPAKQAIDTVDEMKAGMERLRKEQEGVERYAYASTTALADSFGAMGRALADVAVTDLPSAQASFRDFGLEVGFSRQEMGTALNEMDEYKQALIDQADQMGMNIRNIDGSINSQRLLSIALGEGEQAINAQLKAAAEANVEMERIRREEKIRFDNTVTDIFGLDEALRLNKEKSVEWAKAQAESTEDASDTWEDYYDGQTFNLDVYLTQLEEQITATNNWRDNLKKVAEKLPADVYAQVEKMGESGAALVQALADGSQEDIDKFINLYGEAGKSAGEQLKEQFTESTKNLTTALTPDIRRLMNTTGRAGFKDGGFIGFANGGYIKKYSFGGFVSGAGTARSDSIPAMLSNGEYVVNARATAQNRALLEAINSNREIKTGSTVSVVVNPSPGMDEKELAAAVSRRIALEIRKGTI